MDASWARSGLGCASPLRRLNLWGTNAGDLTLSGPGYGVPLNFAVEGRNGGRIPFDAARMAYGAVVLMDGSYELQGSWPAEALIVEFSDPVLGASRICAEHMSFGRPRLTSTMAPCSYEWGARRVSFGSLMTASSSVRWANSEASANFRPIRRIT